jgi:hypothetical protein
VSLQGVRFVRRQVYKCSYGFSFIIINILQERCADACVGQSSLDLVRLAIDVVAQFGKSCGFGLPKTASCSTLASLDCLGESVQKGFLGLPAAVSL